MLTLLFRGLFFMILGGTALAALPPPNLGLNEQVFFIPDKARISPIRKRARETRTTLKSGIPNLRPYTVVASVHGRYHQKKKKKQKQNPNPKPNPIRIHHAQARSTCSGKHIRKRLEKKPRKSRLQGQRPISARCFQHSKRKSNRSNGRKTTVSSFQTRQRGLIKAVGRTRCRRKAAALPTMPTSRRGQACEP